MLAVLGSAGLPAARAADAGRAVYERDCRACHSVVRMRNHVGPSLFGVVGRAAASVSSFVYSNALRGSGLSWSEAALDAFLTDPQAMVPNTAMHFPGLKDATERAAIIAFLKGLD